jgi:hypothetical protein
VSTSVDYPPEQLAVGTGLSLETFSLLTFKVATFLQFIARTLNRKVQEATHSFKNHPRFFSKLLYNQTICNQSHGTVPLFNLRKYKPLAVSWLYLFFQGFLAKKLSFNL